jgi:hypothetical protein
VVKFGALRHEIATQWGDKEERIFGELVWAPPVTLSTGPGQYTLDLAIIKIDAGKLDAGNHRDNSINMDNKYTSEQFMDPAPPSFEFPADRIVTLNDQVPESALFKQPVLDANGDRCLVVFKNGAVTDTTINRANNVSSCSRSYFAVQHQESREWPIVPANKRSTGAFSAEGDSRSCVADAFGRIGGILTGGVSYPNVTDSADVSSATPISSS